MPLDSETLNNVIVPLVAILAIVWIYRKIRRASRTGGFRAVAGAPAEVTRAAQDITGLPPLRAFRRGASEESGWPGGAGRRRHGRPDGLPAALSGGWGRLARDRRLSRQRQGPAPVAPGQRRALQPAGAGAGGGPDRGLRRGLAALRPPGGGTHPRPWPSAWGGPRRPRAWRSPWPLPSAAIIWRSGATAWACAPCCRPARAYAK